MATGGGFRRWRRSEGVRGWMMVSPPALYAVLLLAVPIAAIVYLSFITRDPEHVTVYNYTPTLANYLQAFAEPQYPALLFRSLIVSVAVTAATVLTAYPIAYFIAFKVEPRQKSLWLFLITIPFWTSYIIRVFLWRTILGYNGVVNSALLWLGVISDPLPWINYNLNAVVLVLAHAYAPFAILPIFVALEKIDRSLMEAGRDLGESRLMTFVRVTLPLSVPGVVGAVLIVFIPTIGDYVTPTLIGGSDGHMIANAIQNQFLKGNNFPLGAALSVLSMLLVGTISVIFVFANRRYLRVRQ
jgi:spermidine/putrescine transport system permease protein